MHFFQFFASRIPFTIKSQLKYMIHGGSAKCWGRTGIILWYHWLLVLICSELFNTQNTMKKVALKNYIILFQSIAINAASLLHTTDTNNNKSKHINQYYKRRSYQWDANLHQPTGIASSFEQSIFHYKHQPPICNVEDVDGLSSILHRPTPLSMTKKKQMKHIIQDIFSSYPKFLTKPSLTFGLCRTT